MNFFDGILEDTLSAFAHCKGKEKAYSEQNVWEDAGYSQVILQRDTAFELSGTGFCIACSKGSGFKTVVVGRDICDIKKDTKFARVSVVTVDDELEGQKAYDLIKKIEYVKYHLFPVGYMIRSTSASFKEGVRVSKAALKRNISFENIGNLMLREYMKIPGVKAATVYFVTEESADYEKIRTSAEKNRKVTEALNQVMNNLEFDCASCNLKPICDEVEGMRELHFSKAKM